MEEEEQEQAEESPVVQFVKPPEPEEEDILDAGEDGSIEDVTTVTEEDIMGDDMYGQSPLEGSDIQEQKKKVARARKPVRIVRLPPQQIGGLNT